MDERDCPPYTPYKFFAVREAVSWIVEPPKGWRRVVVVIRHPVIMWRGRHDEVRPWAKGFLGQGFEDIRSLAEMTLGEFDDDA